MTKAEIVKTVCDNTGLDKVSALTAIEAFMDAVKESVESGENVYLRGFGTFENKLRAKKTARNISKNTTVIVPAHNIVSFKASDSFNAAPIKK